MEEINIELSYQALQNLLRSQKLKNSKISDLLLFFFLNHVEYENFSGKSNFEIILA